MSAAVQLEQLPIDVEPAPRAKCRRGTTNGNARGNSKDRRRRREWLIATWPADVQIIEVHWANGIVTRNDPPDPATQENWLAALATDDAATFVDLLPTSRCYRCGCLLTVDTVSADRIIPGAEGGTYGGPVRDQRDGRTNVRPACLDCQSTTGGVLGAARKKAGS